MTRVPFTYTWIEQGRILAGSIPQLPEDIAILRNCGIQDIISLTRRDIRTYPNMDFTGIRVHHAPIPDGGIVDSEQMLTYAHWLSDTSGADDFVNYIHCRGGIGRTGMILQAYYVVWRGMSLAEAREIVKVRRNYEGNASAIDQGSPQREWIETLEQLRDDYWKSRGY